MNVRIDPRILESPATQEPGPSVLLVDEPVFSFVARRTRLAATRTQESIIAELFGNGRIRIDRPLHTELGSFAENVFGSAQLSDEIIAQHHLLPFYRPFVDPVRFAVAIERAKGPSSIAKLAPTRRHPKEIFRATPAVCPACRLSDQATYGFAYYRKSHLIRAVSHCTEHQTPLIEKCLHCGASFSHWELPSRFCGHCGHELVQDDNSPRIDEHTESAIRLSRFCAAALTGQIEWTSEGRRLAAYRQRTTDVVRNRSGVVGDNLARHLEQTFGRDFFDKLEISPRHGPTLGWPALLIHGRLLVDDPIANCLILAALFDSPSHYARILATQDPSSPEMAPSQRRSSYIHGLTQSVFRDTLRLPIRATAHKHKVNYGELKLWVGAYPGLSDRRNAKFKDIKLMEHKQALLDLLALRPNVSRTMVAKLRKGALKFVLRYDPHWLDEVLPRKWRLEGFCESIKRAQQEPPGDIEARNQLTQTLSQESLACHRPVRRTERRLFGLSGLDGSDNNLRSKYPHTLALIESSVESEEIYYRRCLSWAVRDLSKTNAHCDNLIELFVHAHVSVAYVRPLEPFAKELIAERSL